MNFVEMLTAVVLGWLLGMASVWPLLLRVLRYADVRLLPRSAQQAQAKTPIPATSTPALPQTQPMSLDTTFSTLTS